MRTKNYYKILGLRPAAKKSDIRKAYLKLAKKYHPDHNPGNKGAVAHFKEIKEAYEVLSDPKQRSRYDNVRRMRRFGFDFGNLGSTFKKGKKSSSGSFDFGDVGLDDVKKAFQEQFGKAAEGLSSVGDLFDSFFKKSTGTSSTSKVGEDKTSRGEDVELSVTISKAKARTGGKITVKIPVDQECQSCKGKGAAAGSPSKPCKTCEGKGTIALSQGSFALSRPCSDCLGRGKLFLKPCSRCDGVGAIEAIRKLSVTIPARIADGKEIRVPGQGQAGPRGGKAGDLRIKVHIRSRQSKPVSSKAAFSEAEEATVLLNVAQAVLGAKVLVTAPSGKRLRVRIPAGVDPGMVMRLRGKGRDGKDLRLLIKVDLPSKLSESARKKFEAFAREADISW